MRVTADTAAMAGTAVRHPALACKAEEATVARAEMAATAVTVATLLSTAA
jgi:hypothetical protein